MIDYHLSNLSSKMWTVAIKNNNIDFNIFQHSYDMEDVCKVTQKMTKLLLIANII